MLKKQKVSLVVLTLLLLLNIVGILNSTQYLLKILFSYFVLIIAITFLPFLRQKINYSYKLQEILFGLPMILPIFLFKLKTISFAIGKLKHFEIFLIYLLFLAVVLLLLHHKDYRMKSSSPFIKLSISKKEVFLTILGMVYSIFTEEMYFRFFILSELEDYSYYLKIVFLVFSSFLFVGAHYLNKWAASMFTYKNYISQFILSMLSGNIFLVTNSLFYSLILHIAYNFPEIWLILKRLKYQQLHYENDGAFFDDY
ncbi:CPBP family intramembrane glutamic endopeptidase [Streptococcus orisasini]